VLVGGGVFIVIIVGSSLVLGQPGMGVGDAKLGAMLGAFLGWKLALLSALLSVLVGGPLAAGLLATGHKGRKDPLPFGPFLALGGAVSLFWGDALLAWYFEQFVG
jgi:leader peptidase (prepilin peptidase)/N-methyltransferase